MYDYIVSSLALSYCGYPICKVSNYGLHAVLRNAQQVVNWNKTRPRMTTALAESSGHEQFTNAAISV